MKKKKILLIVSILILIVVVLYFFSNYKSLISKNTVSAPPSETKVEYGYPGLVCGEYDREGVCRVYINMMSNSTYTVNVD